MSTPKIYIYAEYQVAIPFEKVEWEPVDKAMKAFPGLLSKTWLSGLNSHSVGGFYAFDSLENAQKYVDGLLIPFVKQIGGNLSVRLFDAEATRDASVSIYSPFFPR